MRDPLHILRTFALALDARFGGNSPQVEAAAVAMARGLNWTEAEVANLRAAALLRDAGMLAGGRDHAEVSAAIAAELGCPDHVVEMIRSHHESSSILAIAEKGAAGSGAGPSPPFCAAIAEAAHRERRLSEIDDLTGLPNTRSLFFRLDAELSRCRRNASTLALLVCDVGDLPPARYPAIADGLRRVCREEDCIARMETGFALVLAGFSREALREKEKRIVSAIGEPVRIGAAFYPEDGSYADDLLAAADPQPYIHSMYTTR